MVESQIHDDEWLSKTECLTEQVIENMTSVQIHTELSSRWKMRTNAYYDPLAIVSNHSPCVVRALLPLFLRISCHQYFSCYHLLVHESRRHEMSTELCGVISVLLDDMSPRCVRTPVVVCLRNHEMARSVLLGLRSLVALDCCMEGANSPHMA
jgi:hypothetical protein